MDKYWGLRGNHIVFTGSKDQFEEWRKHWYETFPKCEDFSCCHELMSCGISLACGDCSIHSTMSGGSAGSVCTDVTCIDCLHRFECKFGEMMIEEIKGKKLKFIKKVK